MAKELEVGGYTMPVKIVEYPQAREFERYLPGSTLIATSERLSEAEAERCISHAKAQGIPEPTIYLLQALSTHVFGRRVGMWVLIPANSSSPRFLHYIAWHEIGHLVHALFVAPAGLSEEYFRIRDNGAPLSTRLLEQCEGYGGLFAEDFRFLFGTPEAKIEPHRAGDSVLGFSLPAPVQDVMGFTAKYRQLRDVIQRSIKMIMSEPNPPINKDWSDEEREKWLSTAAPPPAPQTDPPSEAPETTTPGASVFSDIAGHWAEVDILTCAEVGVLRGDPDGRFRPDDKVTRAELATVVSRLLKQT